MVCGNALKSGGISQAASESRDVLSWTEALRVGITGGSAWLWRRIDRDLGTDEALLAEEGEFCGSVARGICTLEAVRLSGVAVSTMLKSDWRKGWAVVGCSALSFVSFERLKIDRRLRFEDLGVRVCCGSCSSRCWGAYCCSGSGGSSWWADCLVASARYRLERRDLRER